MLISEIGEFGLIERFKKTLRLDHSVIKGSGDDCAVVAIGKGKYLLLTSDMLVEGVDFTSRDAPALIGQKAIAVSLSDIAACAGTPRYALVSVGIRKNARLAFVDRLLKGMRTMAAGFKVNIVGGDLSEAPRLTIDVAMVGQVRKKDLLLRDGAQVGEALCVTGRLGGSRYGRHLTFTPRVKEASFLAGNFNVSSMIDISDGLIQDLGHIADASRVGAVLYEESIPLHKDARSLQEGLSMGEDFELLFTLPRRQLPKLLAACPQVSLIGHIVDKRYGLMMVDRSCRLKQLKARGFTHFSRI
jgi:thiamine-monophosphate kinase